MLLPRCIFAAATLLSIVSCSTVADLTGASKPSGGNNSRAQFLDEVWVSPRLRGKAANELFDSVYFAPVATARLKAQGWWEAQGAKTQEDLNGDARKLARHMQNALISAARNHPAKRLRVVNGPGPGTLIVQTAITELLPAKAFWNAAATAGGFVVPGAGMLGTFGAGAISIEGRLVDGGTGQVIATFRHRDRDKFALVNLDSYTWYGGSEANIDELAQKTAEVLNAPPGSVVGKSAPFKLAAF